MRHLGATPAVLEHLPWRLAGLVLLAVLVTVYHPEQGGAVNALLIPLGMAVATWLLVQNLAAVALGAGILAAIHSAPSSPDWIRAVAYPVLAALCGGILGAVLLQRFRRRIAATHEARWRERRGEKKKSGGERKKSGGEETGGCS
jgi:hypothetical protein